MIRHQKCFILDCKDTFVVFIKLWTQWMLSCCQPIQTWAPLDVFLIFWNRSPSWQHTSYSSVWEHCKTSPYDESTSAMALENLFFIFIQSWKSDHFWPQELGYEPTLSGLSSLNGDMVASSCRRTLATLIQVCLDLDRVLLNLILVLIVGVVMMVNGFGNQDGQHVCIIFQSWSRW